jgi:hypothetical protein
VSVEESEGEKAEIEDREESELPLFIKNPLL